MIACKTQTGQQVLKDRSIPLTPRQRSALILFDGRRTVDEVLAATATTGVTREDIQRLLDLKLIEDVAPDRTAAEVAAVQAAHDADERHKHRSAQERYAEAYPIATALTAGLGLRGFRLNLAVEAATSFEELLAVAPKIREAVGEEKFKPLDKALNDH
jgi:hypothetical protein